MKTEFSEDLRYNYPLTTSSLVIDCGGYKGEFARRIHAKYGCKVHLYEPIKAFYEVLQTLPPAVTLTNAALGRLNGSEMFKVKGDMTGLFADGPQEIVDVVSVIEESDKWGHVDLLKLNCEGMEFELLEAILEHGIAKRFTDIQVQFHAVVPKAQERYETIRAGLLNTHNLTYDFPWCWQNFSLRPA